MTCSSLYICCPVYTADKSPLRIQENCRGSWLGEHWNKTLLVRPHCGSEGYQVGLRRQGCRSSHSRSRKLPPGQLCAGV